MNKDLKIKELGLKDYKETWDFQESLFQDILHIKSKNKKENLNLKTPNYFLFVEHPHVYTLGKSGHIENLLISEEKLNSIDAKFYKINRGGDITYHEAWPNCGLSNTGFRKFFH